MSLRQERAQLLLQAKTLLDKAENEGRNLTPAEDREFNELLGAANYLGKKIAEEEGRAMPEVWGAEGCRQAVTELGNSPGPVAAFAYQPGDDQGLASPETRAALNVARGSDYAAAFWRTVRNWRYPDPEDMKSLTRPELRALAIGTDSAGGFLVPESFERRIVQKLEEVNVMRTLGTTLTLTSDHKIPVEADIGQAEWISEGQSYPESDPSFGQKVLTAHKLGRIAKVSEELLADSAVDLERYLAGVFGRSLGRAEEEAFIAGDGNGKPRGVLLDCEVGLTAAAATAVAADEIIKLYHSLPVPYRARATWLMNDATALALRLLKDTTGQYLWQPGLQAGQPDRLLGRPVAISSAMPEIGAGTKSVLFGDFSYYWIVDRVGRVLQILKERYADTGHIGFRMFERVDGVLTFSEAVVALQHPAE